MPLPSIDKAIADIPFDDKLHNLEKFVWFSEEKAEIDPSGVAGTLTCNGGMNVYHPSGERNYTLAELAALQTFPRGYAWSGTKVDIKRQIGNAVPPEFAQRLFEWIRGRMMLADEAEMRG
jgi:site-specific DNA-cytosine methylase